MAPSPILLFMAQLHRARFWCPVRRSEFIVLLGRLFFFPARPTPPLEDLRPISESGLVSAGFPDISLVNSDGFSVSAPRPGLVANNSTVPALSLVDSSLSPVLCLPDSSRASLPVVLAPSCVAACSSSVAIPSRSDLALATSVIEESLASNDLRLMLGGHANRLIGIAEKGLYLSAKDGGASAR